MKGKGHLRDKGVDRQYKKDVKVCTGFNWFRIKSSVGL
jgi:hypothetical protein